MAVSSGKLEIAAPVSGGYMEITFADSRDRKDTWQHYRNAMVEHLQAALMDRDRVRQLEKVRPAAGLQGDRQDVAVRLADVCRSFIEHMVQALEAGYSMGRSVRYLKKQPDAAIDGGCPEMQRTWSGQAIRHAFRVLGMRVPRL